MSAVVVATASAAAPRRHATLLRSDPAAGAVLPVAPATVRLWFSEEIQIGSDALEVTDPSGEVVQSEVGVGPTDRTLLEGRIRATGPGTYDVGWRVLSDDGHVVAGGFSFSVGRTTGEGVPAPAVSSPSPLPSAAARTIHMAGLALALGPLALLLLMGPAATSSPRSLSGLGLTGATVVLGAAALMLGVQAYQLSGSVQGALAPAELLTLLRGSWGFLWTLRLLGALGLLIAFALARRSRGFRTGTAGVAFAGALLLLVATAANGHALVTPPVSRSVAVQTLHLAATCLWLGGCVAMLLFTRGAMEASEAPDASELRRLVPRFSSLALACVVVLVVTGLYQAWVHVRAPALLTSTGYGRALLVKLAFVALIAVPAGMNRWVVKPRLVAAAALREDGPASPVRRLSRMLWLESALGLAIVAAAGTLAALPPARAPGGEPPAEVEAPPPLTTAAPAPSWMTQLGADSVSLSLDPAALGSNQARVRVLGVAGRPADVGQLRLRLIPPAGSGVAASLQALARQDDDFVGVVMLGAAGEWTVRVLSASDSADFRIAVAGQAGPSTAPEHDTGVSPE